MIIVTWHSQDITRRRRRSENWIRFSDGGCTVATPTTPRCKRTLLSDWQYSRTSWSSDDDHIVVVRRDSHTPPGNYIVFTETTQHTVLLYTVYNRTPELMVFHHLLALPLIYFITTRPLETFIRIKSQQIYSCNTDKGAVLVNWWCSVSSFIFTIILKFYFIE